LTGLYITVNSAISVAPVFFRADYLANHEDKIHSDPCFIF